MGIRGNFTRIFLLAALLLCQFTVKSTVFTKKTDSITIVKDGVPLLDILVDSETLPLSKPLNEHAGKPLGQYIFDEVVSGDSERRLAVNNLIEYVQKISGATLQVKVAKKRSSGIYVGRVADFPWLKIDGKDLGDEGFIIKTNAKNLYLIGKTSLGVKMAVITFLNEIGCRWYFPGENWEIIPNNKTIKARIDLKLKPDFNAGRTIWYGFGAKDETLKDYEKWYYFNRFGGPVPLKSNHTDYNLNIDTVYKYNPDWIAMVDGVRKPLKDTQITKLCYSNTGVIEAIKEYVNGEIEKGSTFISVSPVDGADFCECENCSKVGNGGKLEKKDYTLFITRPDGELVNVVSENYFNAINEVAKSIIKEHPNVQLGSYAYSSYSHPPTFKLSPNVFVLTSSHFRRTPYTLEKQLDEWGNKAGKLGIRDYWSVYYWDFDKPEIGSFNPGQLKQQLSMYKSKNVTGFNAECGNNWGARGLSYYIGAKLLWDVNVDNSLIIKEFYQKAFGPAAGVMERYYVSLYGASAGDETLSENVNPDEDTRTPDILKKTLVNGFKNLDSAYKLVDENSAYAERIDDLKMYFHFLLLRYKFQEAGKSNSQDEFNTALKNMLNFGMRLFKTNMIHTLAMQELRSINWIVKPYADFSEKIPPIEDLIIRDDPPTKMELDKLWEEGKLYLGI